MPWHFPLGSGNGKILVPGTDFDSRVGDNSQISVYNN